jgi:hypothetical protein
MKVSGLIKASSMKSNQAATQGSKHDHRLVRVTPNGSVSPFDDQEDHTGDPAKDITKYSLKSLVDSQYRRTRI